MTPFDRSARACVAGPVTACSVPEFAGGCPDNRRRTEEEDSTDLKEVYKAGRLTVFASDHQPRDHPVQLDFHFTRDSQGTEHWHGLLRERAVFLNVPHLVLNLNSRESLVATLEYIEEETEADRVFVNFRKSRRDRGDLLRAFGFLGFELVQPDDPSLPSWDDAIFMVYSMDRGLLEEQRSHTGDHCNGQDGAKQLDTLL